MQAQAQSLLRHSRFTQWLTQLHPDLISVEANIATAALERLSVVSVFCATFVASMISVQPQEVVVYFFCGLHNGSKDAWQGPNGLVRSLVTQLVMKLVELDILSLDFINNRDYLRDLEDHDPNSLSTNTTIYCVIDGISNFDKNKLFKDLEVAISWLRHIASDKNLIPMFKVLIATPRSCSARMKRRLDASCMVALSSNNLFPTEISHRLIEAHLLRSSTLDVQKLQLSETVEEVDYHGAEYGGYETE